MRSVCEECVMGVCVGGLVAHRASTEELSGPLGRRSVFHFSRVQRECYSSIHVFYYSTALSSYSAILLERIY